MDQTVYHVLLEGRTVGPYDRRTIVGMRIKKALTSEHVLIGTHGAQLTVADLIGQKPASSFNPSRSGSFSVVQAAYPASLVQAQRGGADIPRFRGEVELRIQGDLLRVAGRYRRGFGWKEDRVKIALKDIAHARVTGSLVELWLRTGKAGALKRLGFELFTPESAGELVDWLPSAAPWPQHTALAAASAPSKVPHALWIAIIGVAVVAALMLMVLGFRRGY